MGSDNELRRRKGVEDLRCPDTNGLPDDIVHLLHNSLTHLVILRIGLKASDNQIERAERAAFESRALLARLRAQRF